MSEESKWKVLYEHFSTLNVNDVVTYEKMSSLLSYTFREYRAPYYRALKELEASNKRTMIPVANVGYRVAEAIEHEKVAKNRHRAGVRKIEKSVSALKSADRSQLAPEDRERFDRLEMTASRNRDMLVRLNGKITKVDMARKQDKREVKGDVAAVSASVDRLKEALARQGIDVEEVPVTT